MKVTVTAEHISRGLRNEPSACPIALALGDLLPSCHSYVYDGRIEIYGLKEDQAYTEIPTPDDMTEFIGAFDNQEPVIPCIFELDLTD